MLAGLKERFFGITNHTPYERFPWRPKTVEIDGYKVKLYIPPERMEKYLSEFSKKVDLRSFGYFIINRKGGWFLFQDICRRQNYFPNPIVVGYHSVALPYTSDIDLPIPEDPHDLSGRCAVFDDVWDTGGTLYTMYKDIPREASPLFAVIVRKRRKGQIYVPNIITAVEVDDKWLGGCGMDLNRDGYPVDFPRNYPGIVTLYP